MARSGGVEIINVIVIVTVIIGCHQVAIAHVKPKTGADEADTCLHDPHSWYDGEMVHVNSLVGMYRYLSGSMMGANATVLVAARRKGRKKEVDVQKERGGNSEPVSRLCRRGIRPLSARGRWPRRGTMNVNRGAEIGSRNTGKGFYSTAVDLCNRRRSPV